MCRASRDARDWDSKDSCARHADRKNSRAKAARLRDVAEAADRFLECSIADVAVYAERRRDLLTAIARLHSAGLM
jgi:hypothetical protein